MPRFSESDFVSIPIATARFFAPGVVRVKNPIHDYDVVHGKAKLLSSLRFLPTICTYTNKQFIWFDTRIDVSFEFKISLA